jgi:hypothetical protein
LLEIKGFLQQQQRKIGVSRGQKVNFRLKNKGILCALAVRSHPELAMTDAERRINEFLISSNATEEEERSYRKRHCTIY